jgi:large subunit ribosomal protein L24e
MAVCDFCKRQITKGTGMIYVKKDGKKLDFCSSKCEKNMIVLGRKNVPWAEKR